MKVKLLPLAISTAIALPGVALADGPTVYGKMNVTAELVDRDDGTDDDTNGEFNSNASRLGFKGSEEIYADLSAIYQAEYEISVDGDASVFKQRDIYVGLQAGWGTVKVGKFDTPFKKSQGKIDQFNDMQFGDIKNVIVGENRVGDIIQYSTPAIGGGFSANIAYQADEQNDVDGGGPTKDAFSVALIYSTDMIYAALAMDKDIASGLGGDFDGLDIDNDGDDFDDFDQSVATEATRLTVIGKMDVFELGFLYQMAEESDSDDANEQDGYILSAAMKLGEMGKLRAQYGYSETDLTNQTPAADDDVTIETTQYGFGYDYKLSKQTKLFANYIMFEQELDVDGSDADEATAIQLGMEHKF